MELFLEAAHEAPPAEIVWIWTPPTIRFTARRRDGSSMDTTTATAICRLYIVCGEHVQCVRLRPSNIDASHGWMDEPPRVVAQIRAVWLRTRIGAESRTKGEARAHFKSAFFAKFLPYLANPPEIQARNFGIEADPAAAIKGHIPTTAKVQRAARAYALFLHSSALVIVGFAIQVL